jgi:hypothetical protein
MARTSRTGTRALSVLLGGLVVWQVFFIPVSNCLSMFPAASSEAARMLARLTGRWAELTGQLQGWALYAPCVPTQAAFAAVELRWDDDPRWPAAAPRQMLLSEVEPPEVSAFFRPFGTFRLPAYEAHLSLPLWSWNRETPAPPPEVWHRRLAEAVGNQSTPIEAYLAQRLRAFVQDHPELPPPKQVLLLVRLYPIPLPNQPPESGPIEQPLARWLPGSACSPGMLPVESYDPVTGRFAPVPAEEGADHE